MEKENCFYEKALAALTEGLYVLDKNRNIIFWGKSAERLTGYSSSEVLGTRCDENLLCHIDAEGKILCINDCPVESTIQSGIAKELAGFILHKDGHRVPVKVKLSPITDDQDKIVGVIKLFTLETDRKDLSIDPEKIRISNLESYLTEANYPSLRDIANKSSKYNLSYGILLAEIDGFKQFSDIWGHALTYKLVKMVGNSINFGTRSFDIVSHSGGEKFFIICPYCNNQEMVNLGKKLQMLVENSWVEHNGNFIKVTASFGGAIAEHNEKIPSLLQRAESQLHLSKVNGRNLVNIDR